MQAARRSWRGFSVAALAVLGVAGWRCSPGSASPPRWNLLLVTLDTVRADHLGSYGYREAATPSLDGLAREGVRFAHAQTAAPLTLPSHATLLSGLLPPHHGVRNNGLAAFPEGEDTLATRLGRAGYASAAFIGSFVLDRRFGLARGFQTYDDDIPRGPEGASLEAERSGQAVTDRALTWLGETRTAPFFAWVHLYDAHYPYAPPEPFATRFAASPYDGEIAAVDAQVGRLLELLRVSGLDRRTVVVVAGDHGEGLGEHGERAHGLLLYESTLRVPLLVRAPGLLPAGRLVEAPVSLADLSPTLLDLLGLPPAARSDGQDLAPALRGGSEPEAAPIYAESEYPTLFGWSALAAARRGNWKLIRGAGAELYDLAADPAEASDVAATHATERAGLERPLRGWTADAVPSAPSAADEETRARLASLGYLAASAAASPREPVDPRSRLAVFALFEQAGWDRVAGRPREAAEKLERAAAADPRNPVFRGALAQAERAAGDLEAALGEYRAAIRLAPQDPRLWLDFAAALQETPRTVEATQAAAEAARLSPGSGEAENLRGVCAARAGDLAAARRHFERATALEPRLATAWNNLGNALRASGQRGDATAAYAEAAQLAPGWADPLNGMGVIEIESGRPAEAVAYFDRALQLQPDFDEARRNRAIALQRR